MKKQVFRIAGCIALFGVVFATGISQAQPVTDQRNCRNPQTQIQMNFCAAESAKAADRQLNQVYQKVRAKYKGTKLEKQLLDAQLAWLKFRDGNCAFSMNRFEGGSIAPLIRQTCIERLTKQRTQELEDFLD